MTDYIGAKLSLVSKSDIRYVGILHEIDSANSTVSLEQVRSFGTEGRKGDPALEIPASDNVFEYIIFRGSDVKDLRVEHGATRQSPPAARSVPQDPAILQSGPAPEKPQPQEQQQQQQPPAHHQPQGPPAHGLPPQGPPPQNLNRGGFNGPPQQNFGYGYGFGYGYPPPPQQQQQEHQQQQQQFNGPPQGYGYLQQQQPGQHAPAQQPRPNQGPFAPQPQNAFPELPSDLKPEAPKSASREEPKKSEGERGSQARIVPALPLPAHAPSPKPKAAKDVDDIRSGVASLSTSGPAPDSSSGQASQPKRNALLEVQRKMKTTNTANTAAPALAKPEQAPTLSSAPTQGDRSATVSTREGRKSSPTAAADAGTAAATTTATGARKDPGVRQNGVIVNPSATIVIPRGEYDFGAANAKFNREGLASESAVVAPVYNKSSSFFDSISSEASDRSDARANPSSATSGGRGRGRELRNQERTMNYETFGEDLAFTHNGRGRGRGRGARGGGRGRGGARGRGSSSQDASRTVQA